MLVAAREPSEAPKQVVVPFGTLAIMMTGEIVKGDATLQFLKSKAVTV